MKPSEIIVTAFPLEAIWTSDGVLDAQRTDYLAGEAIRHLLRNQAVQFVVADVGYQLKWIAKSDCFKFWKRVKENIADPHGKIYLEDFVDDYAYLASLWQWSYSNPLILLEKLH